jgi:cytochrome c-type biogenesis protein
METSIMDSFYLASLVALAGGILSFISPCVLPLVPGYLCFAAGLNFNELTDENNQKDVQRRVLNGTFFFVLGFSTVFIILGASASALSSLLLGQKDILAQIAGAIIIIFGLNMMGLLRIGFLSREVRVKSTIDQSPRSKAQQLIAAYIIGLAFAFGWTPCIGPILAGILAIAAGQEYMLQGVALLAIYAAGLGIPFILAALSVSRFLATSKRIKTHMKLVERISGGLLILTGVLIMSGSLQALATYLLDWFPALSQLG